MSQIRSTEQLQSLIRWMSRTIEEREKEGEAVSGVKVVHIRTWRDALVAVMTDIEKRERNLVKAEAAQLDSGDFGAAAGDRCDVLFAVHHAEQSARALERLATFAVKHATRQQMRAVNSDTQTIIDGLEALTMGIQRPLQPKQKPGA